MNLDIKAWKADINGVYRYRAQVISNELKFKKAIDIIFKDWKQSGFGWNISSKKEIYLFNKEFDSEEEWLIWAKKCPLALVEIKVRNGKEKFIQHSCKTRKKRD